MDLNTTNDTFIQTYHLGDYASIIGLIITFIGFGITIHNLIKTRKASELATEMVKNIRKDLKKVDTVAILSSCLAEMEEIKRLIRISNIEQLPERYSKLRASLILIKNDNNALIQEDHKILQGAIVQLKAFEKKLDEIVETNSQNTQISIAKWNTLISNHMDKLREVLIRVKSTVGDKS